MITIEHHRGYVAGDFDMAIDDFMYAIGQEPPNYPMPAIPIAVTIDAEFVGIWERGRGPVFYTDDYETVWY